MGENNSGRAVALLPILVFLLIFLGAGFITGDFYSMPAIVAFLLALLVAFIQNPKVKFADKIRLAAKGVGDENIITMCLIFLVAGAFTGAVKAAGGVESTVNLGLSILPSKVAVAGLFLIGCFISISMGTSVGTITALSSIAVGISEKTGFSLAVCAGAVVGGAMFGDNLSMISDTTIAAVKTQGCDMKDKFRENFLIVLPAAVATILLFLFLGREADFQVTGNLDYNIFRVLPYLVVLIGALAGVNVFVILIAGTVLSLVVGVATGAFALGEMFTHVGAGIVGMYDITVISIIVACIVALVKEYGGIDFILTFIRKRINGERGGEMGIAALALLVDMCTANNTVAIVMSGPIAKEIGEEYGIDPRRTASLLDIFASVIQGILPYGAQLLYAAAGAGITALEIVPYMFYCYLMAVCAIVFILFFSGREK